MNELFSSQTQLIDIDLYYKVEKTVNGQLVPIVIKEEEYNTLKAGEKTKDKAKSLRTQWKLPSWRSANELLEAATIYNFHRDQMDVNWNKFRDSRLKSLLVGWDAKDSATLEPIPCNEDSINSLHQNIALSLLSKYDDATKVTNEEQEKNS